MPINIYIILVENKQGFKKWKISNNTLKNKKRYQA